MKSIYPVPVSPRGELSARRRSPQNTLLVLGGAAGPLFIMTFSLLGGIAQGYDFTRDAISSLEFAPLGYLQQINFVVFGLLQIAFAHGLRVELAGSRGHAAIPALQVICAAAVIGDGVYIRNPAHLTFDLIAFASTLTVLFVFAWRFSGDRAWRGWSWYSIATPVGMMICLTLFGMANRHGGAAGLFERLAVVLRAVWSIALVSRLLLGHSLRSNVPVIEVSGLYSPAASPAFPGR